MSRYLAWIDTPLNNQIEMVEHLKYAGALVPVEPCEHTDEAFPNGRIDGHTIFKGKNFDGPDSENWCEGAGIGDNDA